MAVSKQTVLHVSKLARIDLGDEAQIDTFARQMDQIVEYMDILAEADTSGVEPMFSPMSLMGPLAEDIAEDVYSRDEILAGAPEQEDGFFIVPRVL